MGEDDSLGKVEIPLHSLKLGEQYEEWHVLQQAEGGTSEKEQGLKPQQHTCNSLDDILGSSKLQVRCKLSSGAMHERGTVEVGGVLYPRLTSVAALSTFVSCVFWIKTLDVSNNDLRGSGIQRPLLIYRTSLQATMLVVTPRNSCL